MIGRKVRRRNMRRAVRTFPSRMSALMDWAICVKFADNPRSEFMLEFVVMKTSPLGERPPSLMNLPHDKYFCWQILKCRVRVYLRTCFVSLTPSKSVRPRRKVGGSLFIQELMKTDWPLAGLVIETFIRQCLAGDWCWSLAASLTRHSSLSG